MTVGASVIICSRERPQLLLDTISSVLEGVELPEEIVVVDQSRAPNQALAGWSGHECPVRYIHSATTGLSRARNLAILAASCDLVVIIDDDMFVDRMWFATLVGALADRGTERRRHRPGSAR